MSISRFLAVFVLAAAPVCAQQSNNSAVNQTYSLAADLLNAREWERAERAFDIVAAAGGDRAEDALYWKAYSLNKLGRLDDALAAIAALRKSYPMSRWRQDAAALEMEIKQTSGQNVTAESQPDDEMKLLALNALARTDPDREVPAIEGILNRARSASLKSSALYVLAQSGSPAAQRLMVQAARGGFGPEIQIQAVRYLTLGDRHPPDLGQLLLEIHNASGDAALQREVLLGLIRIGDAVHMAQIPTDTAQTLAENLPLARQRLALSLNLELPAAETKSIVDFYVGRDWAHKRAAIDAHGREANVLIALARVETDPTLKKRIVEHLIELDTPEARGYLLELLK